PAPSERRLLHHARLRSHPRRTDVSHQEDEPSQLLHAALARRSPRCRTPRLCSTLVTSPARARSRAVAASRPSRGPAHARALRRYSVARVASLVATAVVTFGAIGGASTLSKMQSNIASSNALELVTDRPEQSTPNPSDPNAG